MGFLFWLAISILVFILYTIHTSYSYQVFLHKKKARKIFLFDFAKEVKGEIVDYAFFAPSHKIISKKEYNTRSQRDKVKFSRCYNVVKFQTPDSHWELFFHLIKDGAIYNELLTIRVFPKEHRIKSEGNVEKSYGRINIFTNNRYLTNILEERDSGDYLRWLMRHNSDVLLISHNNLHFKIFIVSHKFTVKRAIDMIKALNILKGKIYREEVLEY